MEDDDETVSISVIWRGKKLNVEVNSSITLKEFGQSLQDLTNVKSDTIRLLVPKSHHNISKMLYPFSEEHSSLSLQECYLLEGKPITMMGVFKDEIEEVSQNISKADMRIAGFEEDERRLRQRMLNTTHNLLKLPQGSYIFCDFRTLHLPGIELNPPASEALRRMHMLAADPGIVAIMNKHRWRVGIMTEMAPVGYVGVSPKCILGFNKNHGEEISLRLRTDDLKGFRKYESIKKTLLHELAHMVYSEHDDDFKNLDSQLNQEAANLDWTKSRGHTLNGLRSSSSYEEELDFETAAAVTSHKLGGERSDQLATARAASAAAAYRRLADVSTNSLEGQQGHAEPDPDDYEPDPDDSILHENMQIGSPREVGTSPNYVLNQNSDFRTQNDHNDFGGGESMEVEPCLSINGNQLTSEPDPDDSDMAQPIPQLRTDVPKVCAEPNPDECEHDRDECQTPEGASKSRVAEPDPDDSLANGKVVEEADLRKFSEPDPDDSQATESGEFTATKVNKTRKEPDPDDSSIKRANLEHKTNVKPNPGDSLGNRLVHDEPDSNDKENFSVESLSWDEELLRIQDPVAVFCNRLEKIISMLKSEVSPMDATSVLQTLFKIIKNVIEHPGETRFRRLRKANPQFQRSVAKYKAAMEVLNLVGFIEDIVSDEIGRSETYMVLKRNDPGLLWLAKSSLETCIAC